MNKSNIAILVGIIIIVSYMLKACQQENMKPIDEKQQEGEIKEEKKKTEGGWWDNVTNCKLNGDNSLYCKPKEKWIFPY
jgi:hypothetical protein